MVINDNADAKDNVSKVLTWGLVWPPQSLHLATGNRKSRPHLSASLARLMTWLVSAFHLLVEVVIVDPELALKANNPSLKLFLSIFMKYNYKYFL